jgi:hypothetical protein
MWHDFESTYMEKGRSLEYGGSSSSQEIPRILWDPKVHYLARTVSPRFSILSQFNPVYILPSYFQYPPFYFKDII